LQPVDYQEAGSGPALVFVPGSYATPAAWRAMHKLLPDHRLVSTSILGYGGTAETRRPEGAPGTSSSRRTRPSAWRCSGRFWNRVRRRHARA